MDSTTRDRPPGGDEGARPDPVDAAERLLLRSLPLFLSSDRCSWRPWQAAGITRARLLATIAQLAEAGRVEAMLVDDLIVVVSTCSDRPIGRMGPKRTDATTTNEPAAGATPAANDGETNS